MPPIVRQTGLVVVAHQLINGNAGFFDLVDRVERNPHRLLVNPKFPHFCFITGEGEVRSRSSVPSPLVNSITINGEMISFHRT